ncbi:hypothetical protein KII05_11120, partial [Weissella confusa]|uniref:hypothetical protein n=1 Tax=Weissella confusa TaxID=1583 RepID=UPI001BCC893E
VTATADVAGITLIGKADGSSFEYRIGSLTPVTVTGAGAVGATTKQEVTFTFGTAVNLSAGALVTVNGSVGTVEKVEGTEVLVSFVTPLTLGASVTTFTVGSSATPLEAKTSGEVVTLTSVTIQ